MGYGNTNADELKARSAYRSATNTSFAHTASIKSKPRSEQKIHESLDPKRKNSLGEQIRECFDSEDHPNTVPVFVGFDETGSMGRGPVIIQEKLASLKGMTLRAGLPDVQLCFGAYGDAQNNEVAPVQVGQFEAGLEMEEWLNNLYLEGHGGGNGGETAGLLLYFLANYSRLDSLTKRGKKGYLFLTGDEIALPVTKAEIETYLGETVERDFTIEEVVEMVTQKYEVIFCLVDNPSAKSQHSLEFWTKLLGDSNVMVLENLENIAEVIAGIIAYEEGVDFDLGDVTDMLKSEGSDSTAIATVSSAITRRGTYAKNTTVVATSGQTLPEANAPQAEFL